MEITLPPEQAEFVGNQVKAGLYASADEVLAAGIASLQAQLDEDNAAISRGIEQAEAGHGEPADVVFDRLTRRYEG